MSPEREKMVETNIANSESTENYANGTSYLQPVNDEEMCRESRQLAYDFVYEVVGEKNPVSYIRKRSSSRCIKKLNRMTKVMLERHDIPFKSACTKMKLSKDAPVRRMLQSIAAEMFRNGCNWGRITALFALCRKLAINSKELGYYDIIYKIAGCLADILTGQLHSWIAAKGGWDEYVSYFRDTEDVQEDAKKFLMYTTLALTASFAVALAVWERW
ncbi:expressed hypothetical protein [Trichoplax adhaerens]|uniref:Bcl-2-like protein 1 n=1 Tax=Trichoplax adhaerens TaxID=10228 RepID=B3RSA4_TRIAD|nr:expressed hypothetical protein [Trichoplax adhaerens]ANR94959.1 Bcl-2-like protein 1 [Trichoplax adhaerens]EDV26481.1 expressed hypothetical protein [Trichoplax adhaerens]|eukprot:XP_002110477.1 expressed hypothetical protein [Trichoplax adhaerens]